MATAQISLEPMFKYLSLGMVFSGVLQLAGFVSPGWSRYKYEANDYSYHTGLWYTVTCTNTCETMSIFRGFEGDYHPYRPWQIQTSIALLACFIAVIYLIKARNLTSARMVKWVTIGAYFSLLSGILSLVPAGIFADSQRSSGSLQFLFPYSLFLTGLGGSLALIISLISLCFVLSKQTSEPGFQLSSL
ncbi:uncharacterized protein LOC123524828 [Mercenaria mercenaria]|uniref:uncharacterized protein LOC123524828 n=1 Tax=Mercenaria mercenaria TaxID=6596 RepID=UPI00234E873F|nr:uncharacterized protein LOC123524828 [Mercenaria mercenaria]